MVDGDDYSHEEGKDMAFGATAKTKSTKYIRIPQIQDTMRKGGMFTSLPEFSLESRTVRRTFYRTTIIDAEVVSDNVLHVHPKLIFAPKIECHLESCPQPSTYNLIK